MNTVFLSERVTSQWLRILLGVVVVLIGLFGVFSAGRAAWSAYAYARGVEYIRVEAYESAVPMFERSARTFPHEQSFRMHSQALQLVIRQRFSEISAELTEEQYNAIGNLADVSVGQAKQAVLLAPDVFLNWIVLGNAYAQLVTIEIPGARQSARLSYAKAQELRPHDPMPSFLSARVAETDEEAKEFLEQALSINPRYAPALELKDELTTFVP